jgi:hypothetical protein
MRDAAREDERRILKERKKQISTNKLPTRNVEEMVRWR